ncbi:MAG: ABC transporter permease [Clostridiaceae bacterium]|jgi:peptide/nickel transport system permease protein|nr:ABC transporter permease [Clostridiaceae bacterium]
MFYYISKKLFVSLITLFIISLFAFSLMHLLPGDPVINVLGEGATDEDIAYWRSYYNLDQPILKQYVLWVRNFIKGDMGVSLMYEEDVSETLARRLPVTLAVGIPICIVSIFFGILFGVITAVKRGTWIDQVLTTMANIGIASPLFWFAIMLILIFGMQLNILPFRGFVAPSENFVEYLKSIALPVAAGSLGFVAVITRQTRSNMLEVLNQDYIRTARANGLSEVSILFTEALKNALIPIITIMGMQIRIIVGGSIIIEQVFSIPGIGSWLIRAITNRDYWIVQACVLVISIVTVFSNLLVDILYGFIDPRIRKKWR